MRFYLLALGGRGRLRVIFPACGSSRHNPTFCFALTHNYDRVVKVSGVGLSALWKEKKEKPRS